MQNASSTASIRTRLATPSPLGCAWTITAVVLGVDIVWLVLGGWSVSARGLVVLALGVGACAAPLAIARYRRDARIATAMSFCVLLLMFQAAAATLSYLVVGTNAALVDASLADADHALGFDWLALHAWLQVHAVTRSVLHVAYHSGLTQLVFVVLFLALSGRRAQLESFMLLFIAATLFTIAVSGVFPAAGAWKFHAVAGASVDLSALSHFELLRDGRLREIALDRMQGLISIPSLHAALAVLLVHAVRATRFVLPGFIVLDLAMLLSTPVDGGHYVVDVLAGVGLAVALIALGRRGAARARSAARLARVSNLEAMAR
ncbi:MAG TPA: phosphatase PAP2 family protein [Burkholderiaceae bacterium]|nr:phosphatase PAP2 family protein [Burkholderiaceae bacterium]